VSKKQSALLPFILVFGQSFLISRFVGRNFKFHLKFSLINFPAEFLAKSIFLNDLSAYIKKLSIEVAKNPKEIHFSTNKVDFFCIPNMERILMLKDRANSCRACFNLLITF
jgi:hypothetical protein